MKRRMVIIVIVVLALLGVVGFAYANRSKPAETHPAAKQIETTDKNTEPASSSDETAETPAATAKSPGAYVAYSESAVNAADGTKILFFHASWCPQCRQLDASIKSGAVPDGVTIFKVDYDSNQALRQKYGVTIQTTLVKIDASGKLVKKYVAYEDPTLSAVTSNLLP